MVCSATNTTIQTRDELVKMAASCIRKESSVIATNTTIDKREDLKCEDLGSETSFYNLPIDNKENIPIMTPQKPKGNMEDSVFYNPLRYSAAKNPVVNEASFVRSPSPVPMFAASIGPD